MDGITIAYSVAAVLAVFSLIETTANQAARATVLALFCLMLYLAIEYLRYREFGLAARALRNNGIRAAVRSHLSLPPARQHPWLRSDPPAQ